MLEPDRLQRLLAATAVGDARAFRQLYDACAPHLNALLLRMLKRRDLAEEALQDCFIRIWHKSETYAPQKGAPMAWLMTIARYRALDLLRARRPEVTESELADDDGAPTALDRAVAPDNPLEQAAQSQSLGRLADCMGALQAEQRQGVLLAYYEGFTHAELAQRLGAPLGTVKSWVRRGLEKLRECLEP